MGGSGRGSEEKILTAAFSVFLKNGKAGARMQEIADEAGVNKSLLHYYFHSKEKIYLAVLKDVVQKIIMKIVENLDLSLDFQQIISNLIHTQINTINENKQVFQFVMGEVWMNPDEVKAVFRETIKILDRSALSVIMERINEAVIRKEIRKIDPFQLIVNIFSLDIFFAIISPILFNMTDFSEKKRIEIENNRAGEVFNFVWESIRLRNKE
ncbi:MAG: TetR/AcrR family transcriptional regulator [Spirochaetaceae bacterium]|nr:TetR/AcrR family transcriptional regulator [Spirochaetaceae bacterium]